MCIRKKRSNFIALKVNGYAYFLLAEYYHLILLFMDKSIFSVKAEKPTLEGLKQGIGKTFAAWQALVDFVIEGGLGNGEDLARRGDITVVIRETVGDDMSFAICQLLRERVSR